MPRLIEYTTHHWALAILAVAAALGVLVYELLERARSVNAISPQTAIQLMNKGAMVLDVRDADAFAAGHINGARNVPAGERGALGADQISQTLASLKRFKDRVDHRRYSGGALLGLRGLVFKAHGSSDAFAFERALARAYDAARNRLLDRVHDRIRNTFAVLPDVVVPGNSESGDALPSAKAA